MMHAACIVQKVFNNNCKVKKKRYGLVSYIGRGGGFEIFMMGKL